MKMLLSRFSVLFLLLTVALTVLAQELLQLGNLSYSRAPAPYLRQAVTLSPGFFRKVGGVAFDATAIGRDGLVVIALSHDRDRDDGDRLRVTVRSRDRSTATLSANIHDWELVPIARFANSDEGSAMTLFGELSDAKFADDIRKHRGRVINYHPALDNTLLGLRMMQADIMLFNENAVDLPRSRAGYVLGAGEARPSVEQNRERFNAIRRVLKHERENGNSYSSYVVGDVGQTVEFYRVNGKLAFDGTPSWAMWDNPPRVVEAYDDLRLLRQARSGNEMARALLVARARSGEDLKATFAAHSEAIEQWQDHGSPVERNHALSETISARVAREDGINPTVYSALKKVMHYRALFRHFRDRDPAAYQAFLTSLSRVPVWPEVTTPTVQRAKSMH